LRVILVVLVAVAMAIDLRVVNLSQQLSDAFIRKARARRPALPLNPLARAMH
jgi:hypothetical protein